MTPVVIVSTSRNDEENIEPMYILLGVAVFFCIIYLAMVFFRRYKRHINWLDALSFARYNQRVEFANRTHRECDVETAPKKPTIVRFVIDGKVLGDED